MAGVLTGFAVIGVIIAVGYVCARFEVAGSPAVTGPVLNRFAFLVATPALLFTVVSRAPIQALFGAQALVHAMAAAAAALAFLLVKRMLTVGKAAPTDTVIGTTAASYINANNMGLPVAIFVLGNPEAVVPALLLQLLVYAPLVLVLLDMLTAAKTSLRSVALQPLRNPVLVATAAGALVSGFGVVVPPMLAEPLSILGGAAVPMVLVAFGMSLRGMRPFQAGGAPRRLVVIAALVKTVAMPVFAYLIATLAFGLGREAVFTAVVVAALPTAQNIYNYAAAYRAGELVARDTVLLTTVLAPISLIAAALLLG